MPTSNSIPSLPPLVELNDTRITEAVRAAGEPDWLIERRLAAWRFFGESTPPIWKRTDLTHFKAENITAPLRAQSTTVMGDASLIEQGVLFTTLAEAVRTNPELVQRYLGTAIDPLTHKFTALHAALWQDGIFLYVPRNVQIELPLLATFSMIDGQRAIFPHNLVIIESGASVTFIEEYISPDTENQVLATPATEIFVGDDASLRFITAQMWGQGIYHIGGQRAHVGRNGNIEWISLNLGGRLQHIEAEATLEGDGAHVDWIAATFGNGEQKLLSAPWLRHVGANTEGHMEFKTVVKDSSYVTFDGMIKIEHTSKGTISRLEEHALHLSPNARSDSIPGLKIDTNDVQRAGHASTSGQIDEEQLFYMLSRGIKRDEAIHMIVTGFFESVLDRISLQDLRARASALIERKM